MTNRCATLFIERVGKTELCPRSCCTGRAVLACEPVLACGPVLNCGPDESSQVSRSKSRPLGSTAESCRSIQVSAAGGAARRCRTCSQPSWACETVISSTAATHGAQPLP